MIRRGKGCGVAMFWGELRGGNEEEKRLMVVGHLRGWGEAARRGIIGVAQA